jgi:precorrin-3B synthase
VFATHPAADGALARVRLPGGALDRDRLRVLAGCADDLGDGAVHLTSRGNVQLRGLATDDPELVRRLRDAGFLPAPGHERVRNFLASPASGLAGGMADVRPLVGALDAAVCASPELAGLPGRFLFALDDGRGDVSGEGADVCWRAVTGGTGALLLAGEDTGVRVAVGRAVEALVLAALVFAEARGTGEDAAWRVRELPEARDRIAAAVAELGHRVEPEPMPFAPGLPLGPLDGGRAVCVASVLGRLGSDQVRVLADLGQAVVTPWRSILLPEVSDVDVLVDAGFVVDPDAPKVTACVGRPGCAKSRADVRADALRAMPFLPAGFRAHFAGCERRCGRPSGEHHDVLAEEGGYRLDGTVIPVDELTDSLAQKGKQ